MSASWRVPFLIIFCFLFFLFFCIFVFSRSHHKKGPKLKLVENFGVSEGINGIPNEILFHFFEKLNEISLARATQVCVSWWKIIVEPMTPSCLR